MEHNKLEEIIAMLVDLINAETRVTNEANTRRAVTNIAIQKERKAIKKLLLALGVQKAELDVVTDIVMKRTE